ncbi:MAG: L-histidine N(alpha)-methyltransferase, partial [Bacteroidetes bacterium]|nr:L-histidine N(alpha)-methyltransferase [Bacteroidota bacterium]
YKYTLEDFKNIESGRFDVKRVWIDDYKLFSVQYLKVKD